MQNFVTRLSFILSIALIALPFASVAAFLFGAANSFHYHIPDTGWIASWKLTLVYGTVTTVLQFLIGVYLALIAFFFTQKNLKRKIIVITLCVLPYSIPPSITVMMFDFGFLDQGYVTNALRWISLIESPLQSSSYGRFGLLCLVSVWQYTPFFFIVAMMSFYSIPHQLIWQASSDGAKKKNLFFEILFPYALPALLAAFFLRLVLMLGKVDLALLFHNKSLLSGAETVPVQIVVQTLGFSSGVPGGLIFIMIGILIAPLSCYAFFLRFSK